MRIGRPSNVDARERLGAEPGAPGPSPSRAAGAGAELLSRQTSSRGTGTAGRQANLPEAKAPSGLERLPVELIGQVVAHLDSPVDGAALALASRELHAKVSNSFASRDKRTAAIGEQVHGFLNLVSEPFRNADNAFQVRNEDIAQVPRLATDAQLSRMAEQVTQQLHHPDAQSREPRMRAAMLAGALVASPRVAEGTKQALAAAVGRPEQKVHETDLRQGMTRALRGVLNAQPGAGAETFAPLTDVVDAARKRTLRNPLGKNPYKGLAVLDKTLREQLPSAVADKLK